MRVTAPPSLPVRRSVSRQAPAKLNLALAVGPARAGDGFHPIASWMHPIELADELLVTRLEDDRLSRYAIVWHESAPKKSPIDWSITKDLAVRAHHLVEARAGRSLPVQLKLDKRIPVGGGLGGGSSDAAAMLLAVRELFDLDLPRDEMVALAMQLGSDVAFFLEPGPAFVGGFGERIERTPALVPGEPRDVLLVIPPFGCATGPVYRAFDGVAAADNSATGGRAGGGPEFREGPARALACAGILRTDQLFNDLARPAEIVAPALEGVRARAARAIGGEPVHVTGSGSTLFCFPPGGDTPRALSALRAALGDDVIVLPTRFRE